MIGNIQEAKARGGSVIALTTEGHRSIRDLLDPTQDFLIEVPEIAPAAHARPDGGPAAAARVPHRGAARLRRRSAEKPGEERHGRVGTARARRRTSVRRAEPRPGRAALPRFLPPSRGSRPCWLRAFDQICGANTLAQTDPIASSTARASVSSFSACLSSIAAEPIAPIGLAMFLPAMSGAEPCTGSKSPGAVAEARGRQEPERADDRAGFVREDVAEQVLGEDDVEARRRERDLHRARIDVHVIERHVRIARPRRR